MNKIFIVLQREYLVRVRKRTFILMTFLSPLLFAALFVVPIWLSQTFKNEKVIEVIDESGKKIADKLQAGDVKFIKSKYPLKQAKDSLESSKHYAILYIPKIDLAKPEGIKVISKKNISIEIEQDVRRAVEKRIEDLKLLDSGIDKDVLAKIKTDINLGTETLKGEESSSGAATAIGFLAAFIIYFAVFLYGSQVMRGVIEEKSNRIVEVMISSVKPFQMMMGKIAGIALIGLTQFVLWIILTYGIITVASSFMDVEKMAEAQTKQTEQQMEKLEADENIGSSDPKAEKEPKEEGKSGMAKMLAAFSTINIPLILGGFLFYFLGGYLLYSSLFAAVASAVDNEADTQQFQLPISAPLIIGFLVAQFAVRDPDGALAVWTSIIPFTSPIVMLVRLPFGGVTALELIASMVLLAITFVGITWVAARIYRIGILTHGAKITYKELAKWIFMKM